MSNLEVDPLPEVLAEGASCTAVEVLPNREVPLGGIRAMTVHRTLPQRGRSLVGAWCFLDHYGPDDVLLTGGMSVPRHPHTGLATVSWLFSGEIDHLDSDGNAAAVRPGELNVMIAGRGITHQELDATTRTTTTTTLHGVQLWFALPEAQRFREHGFTHFVPEPVRGAGFEARVFIGEALGSTSPVVTHTPDLLGAEILLEAGTELSLAVRRDSELAVLAENNALTVNGAHVPHRQLAYVPPGADTLTVRATDGDVRLILLGGVPLGERIVMWWNFIGRSHEEIVELRRRYQAELGFEPADPQDAGKPALFGPWPEGQPAPLPAPVLPTTRLKPRG